MEIEILSTYGLGIAAKYQRLPMKRVRSGSINVIHREDVDLLQEHVLSGDDHAKVMRMVDVWLVIQAPRYWWQEFDTYKIGVEKLSESTMHTLLRDGVWREDFTPETPLETIDVLDGLISQKCPIDEVKAALPEGFLQARLVKVNYQTLRRMWLQRRDHRLPEWHTFLDAIRFLPYADDLIFCE